METVGEECKPKLNNALYHLLYCKNLNTLPIIGVNNLIYNRKAASLASAASSFPVNLSRANPSQTAISECAKLISYSASAVGEDGGAEPRAPLLLLGMFWRSPLHPSCLDDGGRVALVPGVLVLLPGHAGPSWCLLVSKTNDKQIYSSPSLGDFHSAKTPCLPPLRVHLLLIN